MVTVSPSLFSGSVKQIWTQPTVLGASRCRVRGMSTLTILTFSGDLVGWAWSYPYTHDINTPLPRVFLPSNLLLSYFHPLFLSSSFPFLSLPVFFPIVGVWIRRDGGGLPATTGRRETIPWPLLPPQPSTVLWSAAIRRLGEIDHTGGIGDSYLLVGEMLLFSAKKENHLSSIQLFLLW